MDSAVFAHRGGASPKLVGGGGGQNEKTETYGYNFYSLWHMKCNIIFSTPKAWCNPTIITRK